MIRQDYILRMIEQAAQMIARLLNLADEGDRNGARELEGETAAKFLDLTGANLEEWGDEKLYAHLKRNGPPVEFSIRLGVAVALLDGRAQCLEKSGLTAEANEFVGRAIGILLRSKIESHRADIPEFAPGLEGFLGRMDDANMPVGTAGLLVCYHEHMRQFAAAEDALFRLQELVGNDRDVMMLGQDFYRRLLRETDETLEAGNLPRPEVEQGAAQWRKLFP
jgi:hypothetical protein